MKRILFWFPWMVLAWIPVWLLAHGIAHAVTSKPIDVCQSLQGQTCNTRVCAVPVNATDPVHVAGQGWVPYNAVSASAAVYDCTGKVWTSLAGAGIPLYSALPPGPAPDPVPAKPDYTSITGFLIEHSSDGGVTFDGVGTTIQYPPMISPQCFRVTPLKGTTQGKPITVCPTP